MKLVLTIEINESKSPLEQICSELVRCANHLAENKEAYQLVVDRDGEASDWSARSDGTLDIAIITSEITITP